MECLEKRKHWERDETDAMSLTNVNEKAVSWMASYISASSTRNGAQMGTTRMRPREGSQETACGSVK